MGHGRHTTITGLVVAILAAACSSAPAAPSEIPSPSASGESPTAVASPSASPQRGLASFAPDDAWRPILELVSGSGGKDEGPFDVGSRYRIVYDCVGDGSITVRVATRVRARRQCSLGEVAEPEVVRGLDGGRLQARVVAQGEVEWIVRFEVPQ